MSLFSEFLEIPVYVGLSVLVLFIFGVALFLSARKVKWDAKMLAYGALCISISFVLSYIRLMRMPQGGSITPASMLPIMLFAYVFGVGPGLICGLAYGMLQMLVDPYLVNWIQAALDYPVAFGMLALAGVLRKWDAPLDFSLGVIIAGLCRIFCHVLSGVVFFAEYAPENMNPWIYSIVYNLSGTGIDTLICAVIAFIPPVRRAARRLAARQKAQKA